MSLIVISVDEKMLPSHSKEEFKEWLEFVIGDSSSISLKNPLCDNDLCAKLKEIGH